jgi:hypothetical protein
MSRKLMSACTERTMIVVPNEQLSYRLARGTLLA